MMKILVTLSAVVLSATVAQASLHINAGDNAADGEGPGGADANYLGYDTGGNEQSDTGALQTFNGINFAEGGLAGTYNVGVEITWPDNTGDPGANNTKQSYGRSNPDGYPSFFEDWVGADNRTAQGGIGVGTRFRLNLTGLAANQEFTLTSYHFDPNDQSSFFTTSASGSDLYEFGDADGVGGIDTSAYAYDFTLTSDASGNASIDYAFASGGIFVGLNGFDLQAVPEPATLGLVAAFGGGILFIRRRFMI
jgi:hypothetical protein